MAQRLLIGFFHRLSNSACVQRKVIAWSYTSSQLPFSNFLSSFWNVEVERYRLSTYVLNHVAHDKHTRRSYSKKAKSQSRLNEDEVEVVDLKGVVASMQAAIDGLKYEYTNTIIARITPAALDRVSVEIEGQSYPLKQVAQIGMPNPSLMVINLTLYPQAVDTTVNALRNSDLNLSPIREKNVVKVPIPKMSKELREKLVKMAKSQAEKTKVGIRKARQKGITVIKKRENVSKDTVRKLEKHVQQLTDDHTQKVDEMLKAKTNELIKGT